VSELTISQQCKLLAISRSSHYYKPHRDNEQLEIEDLQLILGVLNTIPFYGYRKISRQLLPEYPHLTRKRVRRIMNRFGLMAIFPKMNLSKPRKDHKKYPYLLSGKQIRHPNQVWATDITYSVLGVRKYMVV
jgi:putative transposase